MADPIRIDLFAEDRAHEELLRALLERMAREQQRAVQVQVRSARGGHGRAIQELKLYQRSMLKGVTGSTLPDLLVVAIDANCKSYTDTLKEIQGALQDEFRDRAVGACPDPHIERWYLVRVRATCFRRTDFQSVRAGRTDWKSVLRKRNWSLEDALADLDAFQEVVGVRPCLGKRKCERDVYKRLLAEAVVEAGYPAILGGIEFARELAEAMNYFRAGKSESALKHFLEETAGRLKTN